LIKIEQPIKSIREGIKTEQPIKEESFHNYLNEYRKQLEKGDIKKAYKGLMEYFENLRLYLKNKYPDYFLSGSVHFGQMDFTYFYFFPKTLKRQKLKIVILFIHDTFKIEVWLSGYNRSVQVKYWKLFKETGWKEYHIAPTTKGVNYIADFVLVDNPDFSNLDALTNQIEKGTLKFIKDVEDFLSKLKN
jgi:hypothetical protein